MSPLRGRMEATMKKLVSGLLVVILILGLAIPAFAADDLDSRLTKVTLSVKNTIDIGDHFDNFSGTLSDDGYTSYWNLNWYNDEGSEQIYITADENGKVFSYSYYKYDYYSWYRYNSYFEPAFPSVSQEDARQAAKKFLDKVLGDNESAELVDYGKSAYETAYYSFYGNIKVNGLPSPFGLSITVSTSDLTVSDFLRDDLYTSVSGDYPPAKPSITPAKAKEILSGTYKFEPLYIHTDDINKARLVYLPMHSSNSVVDALTGELVENTWWARPLYSAEADYDKAALEGGGAVLTEAELEGIALLEGVLKPEELDAAIRKISVLGINQDFKVYDTDYYLDDITGEVSASVIYRTAVEDLSKYGIPEDIKPDYGYDSPFIQKYIRIDAKTGDLLSVNTYYNNIYMYHEGYEPGNLPSEVLSFLKAAHPDEFASCGLYSSSSYGNGVKQDEFNYCQKVNGFFYTGNSINVTVNTHTGKLDFYSFSWDHDIEFEPVTSVVSEKDVIKTYSDAFEYELGYTLKSIYDENGYPRASEIILSYTPYFNGYITGVSATTGELIFTDYSSETLTIAYNDIDGCAAKEALLELGEYGIGFYSDSFKPGAVLTQKDMVLLLVSADGTKIKYDDLADKDLDWIYDVAVNLGILKKEDMQPDKAVTRAEMVRTLVSMSGYGRAAEFRDIFICGFKDDAEISEEDYGYIAIGKGLGIIEGGKDYSFRPNESVTREEAAVMLYNFMRR